MKGVCKWFNDKKGFGFIATEDGDEVFVHYSNIVMKGHKTLKDGDLVMLDVVTGEKGDYAVNVVPV